MTPRQLARQLVRKYQTRDPFELAQCLEYLVLQVPLCEVRGFYQYLNRRHIVYLNNRLSGEEQRFVCAHELAHSILHKRMNRIFMDSSTLLVSSRYEREADHFAMELLYPDELFDEYRSLTVHQIASMLQIREELVAYRLEQLPRARSKKQAAAW